MNRTFYVHVAFWNIYFQGKKNLLLLISFINPSEFSIFLFAFPCIFLKGREKKTPPSWRRLPGHSLRFFSNLFEAET